MISRVALDSSATVWSVAIVWSGVGRGGRRVQRGGGDRGQAGSKSHARVTADLGPMFRLLFASIAGAIRLSGVRLLTVAVLLAFAAPASAAPGDLDRGFANGGRAAYSPRAAATSPGWSAGRAAAAVERRRRPGREPAPAALTLTAGGRLASRTALPGVGAPRFAGGYALSRRRRADALRAVRSARPTASRSRSPTSSTGSRSPRGGRLRRRPRGPRAGEPSTYSRTAIALRYLPDGRLDPATAATASRVSATSPATRCWSGPTGGSTCSRARPAGHAGDGLDARGRRVAGFRTRT